MKKIKKFIPILLVLLLVLSMAPFASADDDPVVSVANAGLIDPNREGSITIHKFDDSADPAATGIGEHGDGTEITNTADFGYPLGGITFKATFLPIATANTSVLIAQSMVLEMNTAQLNLYQKTGTTGGDGTYTFEDLKHGTYLVEEVDNDAIATTTAPFLVSIPMTNPKDRSSWLYDIHVYPKNTIAEGTLEKQVLDGNGAQASSTSANIGDVVTWVITATYPGNLYPIDPAENKGYLFFKDKLDIRLNLESIKVEHVDKSSGVKVPLTQGVHYILTEPDAINRDIIIDFTTVDGIATLAPLTVDSSVEITITTRINETAVTDLNKTIKNSAEMYFNNTGGSKEDPDPSIPSKKIPEVNLLGIAIKKVDENDKLLDGAVFTIYSTQADAEAGTPVTVTPTSGVVWTETSGSSLEVVGSKPVEYYEGYIYFSGKALAEAGLDAVASNPYYFVETTSPAEYELLNTIHALGTGTTTTVKNKLIPSFELPITGGSGTVLFTVTGILLIGGAVTLLLVSRRKKKTK